MKIGHYLHPSFGEGGITNLATKLIRHQAKLGIVGVSFSTPRDCPPDCDFIITHGQMGWFHRKPSQKVKIVHMFHGSILDRIFAMKDWVAPKAWYSFSREWASAMAADHIITDSRAPLLEKVLPGKKFNAIVPAGFEKPEEMSVPLKKIDFKNFTVLFVGREEDPVKNFALAENIFKQLKSRTQAEFLVVPRDTGFLTENELKFVYKNASALLLTSHTEGGPLVVLEALSEGLPVCSTNVGYVAQAVDSRCGKIFSQVSEAVDFLELLKKQPETRAQMSEHAFEQAKKFSWETYARKVTDCLIT